MAASDEFVIDDEVKWKAFIQLNRTRLVSDLDYESLSAEAVKRNICTAEDVKRIKFNSSANFRRVGAFLDGLIKKTQTEYFAFRDCLKYMDAKAKAVDDMLESTFPSYVTSLEEQMARLRPKRRRFRHTRRGDAVPQFPRVEHANKDEIEEMIARIQNVQVPEGFQHSEINLYESIKNDAYKIGRGKRGRALMVTMTVDRNGWKPDVEKLAIMFKALGFDLVTCFDPTHFELQDKLQDFASDHANKQADCIFVVLMGHGGRDMRQKDYLKTSDGCAFWVEDEIQKCFNTENAEFLRGKPKIFLSQMCRGGKEDEGILVDDSEPVPERRMAKWCDFLFGYASLPGYKAYRDETSGSWYIQTIAEVFLSEAHNQSVLDMLTKVNSCIDKKHNDIKMPTVLTASLNHKLFLFPGIGP